jgi:hypothetical protein
MREGEIDAVNYITLTSHINVSECLKIAQSTISINIYKYRYIQNLQTNT